MPLGQLRSLVSDLAFSGKQRAARNNLVLGMQQDLLMERRWRPALSGGVQQKKMRQWA